MKDDIGQQIVTDILRNKIEMEEETLQLLEKTGLLAEDQVVHSQMTRTQQKIVNYYRALLEKVNISTIKH